MGAIVIRTRYDEGTESAEVVTSGPTEWVKKKWGKFGDREQVPVTVVNGFS
jgi:hypothetical protein